VSLLLVRRYLLTFAWRWVDAKSLKRQHWIYEGVTWEGRGSMWMADWMADWSDKIRVNMVRTRTLAKQPEADDDD
jgi:hypothetical protein